jgi:hypothetical protein
LSVGIFNGALLLFYALHLVLVKFFLNPKRIYDWKFYNVIIDMKEVIRMGDTIPDLYNHRSDGFGTREHILFCFRHIDTIPSKGKWPNPREVLGQLAYSQPVLVDVTVGIDVEERGKTVVERTSAASAENRSEQAMDMPR